MATERAVFMFSFHEHDDYFGWYDNEAPAQSFMQMVASERWVQEETGGPGDFGDWCEEKIANIEDLRTRFREFLGAVDWLDVVRFLFDKLKALIEEGGWQFVGGELQEFQDDNCDTEIRVVLER